MKLPNTITSLAISGNEAITEANLAPYRDLETFVCFGLKKGKTAQDHNQRGNLAVININGLAKLQMLRVPNNQLSSIFELGYEYPRTRDPRDRPQLPSPPRLTSRPISS